MTVSREQFQRVADFVGMTISENVLQVGRGEIWEYDPETRTMDKQLDESVRVVTKIVSGEAEINMSGSIVKGTGLTEITVGEMEGVQHISISAFTQKDPPTHLMTGLLDPVVRFLPEGSNDPKSGIPLQGVIFIAEDRVIHMNQEGRVTRDFLP